MSKQTQEALGDMTKVAQEKLSAFRTLTAFNSQCVKTSVFLLSLGLAELTAYR